MDVVSWGLSTLDYLFSNKEPVYGEPGCPSGSAPSGYIQDDYQNKWKLVCLFPLEIEDIEDVINFGAIVSGVGAIGWILAIMYRAMGKQANATAEVKSDTASLVARDRELDRMLDKFTTAMIEMKQTMDESRKALIELKQTVDEMRKAFIEMKQTVEDLKRSVMELRQTTEQIQRDLGLIEMKLAERRGIGRYTHL